MTTNQTERVPDEELDQMIWKLERDGGMTPKQLSLMRELREARRAKGEPVAWIVHARTGDQLTTDSDYVANAEGILGLHSTPLYTAPPAPAVPDTFMPKNLDRALGVVGVALPESKEEFNFQIERWTQRLIDRVIRYADEFQTPPAPTAPLELVDLLSMAASAIEDLLEHTDPNTNYYSGVWADVPGKLRAAMLNHSGDTADMDEPVSNRDELNYPATPDGWIPVCERMPPEGTPLLVCSGNGVVQRTVYGFDGGNWLDWYEQYDPVKTEPDDLWQPLPAAPKEVG